MKRIFAIFISLILFLSCIAPASAHPGSLDENGGHWNHSTGEYHYHDGKHTTGSSSSSSSSSGSSFGSSSKSDVDIGNILAIAVLLGFAVLMIWPLISSLFENNKPEEPPKSPPKPQPPQSKPPAPKPQPPKPQSPQPKPQTSRPTLSKPQPPQPAPPRPVPPSKPPYKPPPIPEPTKEPNNLVKFDLSFFSPIMRKEFNESLRTERFNRAQSETFLFENVSFDQTDSLVKVSCTIRSQTNYNYHTTLTSCTCLDNSKRHVVCKHMIALAIRVHAITQDTSEDNYSYHSGDSDADMELFFLSDGRHDSNDNDLPF